MNKLRNLDAVALVVILGAGAGLVSGCQRSPTQATPTTTIPVPVTVPVPATTTAATSSTTPPTTAFHASAPQKSQDDAGSHLVSAWRAGDRAAALADATPLAVDAVFATPYPAGGVQARGCASAVAGPSSCVYRILANGSLLDLSAEAVPGGWIILAARFES